MTRESKTWRWLLAEWAKERRRSAAHLRAKREAAHRS